MYSVLFYANKLTYCKEVQCIQKKVANTLQISTRLAFVLQVPKPFINCNWKICKGLDLHKKDKLRELQQLLLARMYTRLHTPCWLGREFTVYAPLVFEVNLHQVYG